MWCLLLALSLYGLGSDDSLKKSFQSSDTKDSIRVLLLYPLPQTYKWYCPTFEPKRFLPLPNSIHKLDVQKLATPNGRFDDDVRPSLAYIGPLDAATLRVPLSGV